MAEHDGHAAPPLFGVSAEFATPQALLAAALTMRRRDFGRVEAYTPAPVRGLAEALSLPVTPLPLLALLAGLAGGIGMMAMMIFATTIAYPFNVGGRPPVSWPVYVIPSVSVGALVGAVAVFLVLLFLNRLPRLNHPAFNIIGFERASQDRFFLCVLASEGVLDVAAVEACFVGLDDPPLTVQSVPR